MDAAIGKMQNNLNVINQIAPIDFLAFGTSSGSAAPATKGIPMPSPAHENYLVTEVMTATPQKLQLMLIEAAIRCAARAGSNGARATTSRPARP